MLELCKAPTIADGTQEKVTFCDVLLTERLLGRELRNHDLVLLGRVGQRKVLVAVEAKAVETSVGGEY